MRLKELRKEKSLYQKDVAAHLGIDRTTYVKYENGSSEPPIEALLELCRFYSVSMDYLLGLTDERSNPINNTDGVRKEVIDFLVDLSPDEVQRVRDFVSGLRAGRAK